MRDISRIWRLYIAGQYSALDSALALGLIVTLIQITPYWQHGEGYAELSSEFASGKIN